MYGRKGQAEFFFFKQKNNILILFLNNKTAF